MKSNKELKEIVRSKYQQIALNEKKVNDASCCGTTDVTNEVYNIMTDDYSELDGYNSDADLGLGCGLPTKFAKIRKGDTVIDLGSGAGNDAFIARHETGANGRVLGIDFSDAMINKARINAEKLGLNNVEFRLGDIDNMPVSDNVADVIVSNCVLNLVPDKKKVFSEVHRVLKPTGHFSISDIVLIGDLPDALREDAEMYAGCVAGAIQKDDYLELIEKQGFRNITIQKEKQIIIPDDILKRYLNLSEIEQMKEGSVGIFSISVYAEREEKDTLTELVDATGDEKDACCEPDSGCC